MEVQEEATEVHEEAVVQ